MQSISNWLFGVEKSSGDDVAGESSSSHSPTRGGLVQTLQMAKCKAGELINTANKKLKDQGSRVEVALRDQKTLIGDFLEREASFALEQLKEGADSSSKGVPPWSDAEGDLVKKQCLALSLHENNLLREPPVGCDFNFQFATHLPQAIGALENDQNLQKLRFSLVPKRISEEAFWRNYFYRVFLIKKNAAKEAKVASEQPQVAQGEEGAREEAAREEADDWENELLASLDEYELVAANGARSDPEWIEEIESALYDAVESAGEKKNDKSN